MTVGRFSPFLTRWSGYPLVVLVVLLCAGLAVGALTFPPLTGRVVDEANILSAQQRDALESKLAELETKSGIQLVVATVGSLQGQEIEPFANELFRTWKLGEKAKNNGVLLLVAPNEHRVRIEAGYGLEGTLTDALSKIIIANAIAPRFKMGDFDGGVSRGVDDIITVLTTDAAEWQQRPSLRLDNQPPPGWLGRFGELVMTISAQDRKRISAAIHAVEAKTSGEIVCVLAQASSDATALPILIAALVALAAPWLMVAVTAMPVNRILLVQILVFFALAVVLCLPRIRIALVPRAARRAIAYRVAMEQFMIRGVGRKQDRTGILIFVSLAERYARIIADQGIATRVPQAQWQGAVDALIAHISSGRIADGFVTAIDLCGNVLEQHFPRSPTSRDELPDRIYMI